MQKVEIRLKGYMNQDWSEWFEGFSIQHNEAGETVLVGEVRDQAALYGLIAKLRDLGVPLVAVNPIENQAGA